MPGPEAARSPNASRLRLGGGALGRMTVRQTIHQHQHLEERASHRHPCSPLRRNQVILRIRSGRVRRGHCAARCGCQKQRRREEHYAHANISKRQRILWNCGSWFGGFSTLKCKMSERPVSRCAAVEARHNALLLPKQVSNIDCRLQWLRMRWDNRIMASRVGHERKT